MVTPNFENIAEINLAGEGFVESKDLANKFVTMFYVCGQLLSKQMHYDWGLRAMTGVLRIAGGMKRAEPDKSEQQILMRAMRDTNLPKFVQADYGIFLGLINDLFPKVHACMARAWHGTCARAHVHPADPRMCTSPPRSTRRPSSTRGWVRRSAT